MPWTRRPAALARLRLADLRRRQGRFAEADAALDELDGGVVSAVRAALALDRGDAGEAARQAEASLRLVPGDDLVERVDALEVLARARAAAGDAHAAHRAAAELVAIAGKLGTRALRAAELATGAAATASRDPEGARVAFERASGKDLHALWSHWFKETGMTQEEIDAVAAAFAS